MISSLLAADGSVCFTLHGWMLHQLFLPPNLLQLLWVLLLNVLPQNHGCNALPIVVKVFTNHPWFWQGAKVGPRDRHHLQVLLFELLLWTKRTWSHCCFEFWNLLKGHINTATWTWVFGELEGTISWILWRLNTLVDDRISYVSISSRTLLTCPQWPISWKLSNEQLHCQMFFF